MPGNEQYIISRAIVSHLAERPDPSREVLFWIDADTKIPYVSDGTSWNQLGGGGGSVSDATTTTPGVMLTDVAPSGAHPVALTTDGLAGRFSGAFYHDPDGVTIVSGGGVYQPTFTALGRYYDTDLYLQSGHLHAPFDGYYRLTAFVYSDTAIQADYELTLTGGPSSFTVSGHGTATDGINASYSETFHFAAGTIMSLYLAQFSGSDQLMFGFLQVEYLGS